MALKTQDPQLTDSDLGSNHVSQEPTKRGGPSTENYTQRQNAQVKLQQVELICRN